MARPTGETLREIYRKVLKLHCDRDVKGGQEVIADRLEMTRKTFNRALNGHAVDPEYLTRITEYTRQLIADDPDLVEAVYKRDEKHIFPEVRIAEIVERATPFPRERCRLIASEIWRGIRTEL